MNEKNSFFFFFNYQLPPLVLLPSPPPYSPSPLQYDHHLHTVFCIYCLLNHHLFSIINIHFFIIVIFSFIITFTITTTTISKSIIFATYVVSTSEIYRPRRCYGRDVFICHVNSRLYYVI